MWRGNRSTEYDAGAKICYEAGAAYAVEHASFSVSGGDFLCIVGENGSGKTTLIRLLAGLAAPGSGRIRLEGIVRRQIGYLPQQTPVQKDFPASVTEVVLSGRLNRTGALPFFSKLDRAAAETAMKELGVWDLRRKSYRELSGGQQQKTLLARALCACERLLILDEPVTGLDPIATVDMYAILERLHRQGLTILMVSHDVGGALRCASKILHMDRVVRFFGTAEDYRASDIGRRMTGQDAPEPGRRTTGQGDGTVQDGDAPGGIEPGAAPEPGEGGPYV